MTGATVLPARWTSSFTAATRNTSNENVTSPFVTAGATANRVTVRSITTGTLADTLVFAFAAVRTS